MMKLWIVSAFSFFLIMASPVAAQKSGHPDATNCDGDYCWGEKREDGKVKFAMYSDNFNFGEYAWETAEEPLHWLLENIPFLHIGMYVNGYKIYNHLVDEAKDPARKQELQDRLLGLLDKRITYFGDEDKNLQRKGLKAYPFLVSRGSEYYDELFSLYSRVYELNGNDTYSANLVYYMSMAKVQFKRDKINAETLLQHYEYISSAVQYNLNNASSAKESDSWEKIAGQIDDMLPITELGIDCQWVNNKLGSAITGENPDFDKARKALKYLIQLKCTDDPLFLQASEVVFNQQPAASLASVLAKKYVTGKEYEKALKWYDEAIALTGDKPEEMAEMLINKAQIYTVTGNKSEARAHAIKAAETSSKVTAEAYTLVGDLYLTSGEICTSTDPVKYRTIYLAAYDAYQKAGNQQKMAMAQEQFPTMEEIFTAGYELGQSVTTGCWIGTRTTIRKRPSTP